MQDGHRTSIPRVEAMRRSALLSAFLIIGGCEGSRAFDSAFTVRDSAGVQIAESLRPEWSTGAGWTIDPVPVVEIGKTEGEDPYLFTSIVGIAVLGNGSIAVVDYRSAEVRIFDMDGQHLATFGGRGGGPGKFAFFPQIVPAGGDTILTWDRRPKRRQWFLSDGTVLRGDGLPLTVGSAGTSFSASTSYDIARDGTLLAHSFVDVVNGELENTMVVYHIVTDLGERVAAVPDTFPWDQWVYHGNAHANQPFRSWTTDVLLYPPAELVLSGPEGWQLSIYGADGALSRVVRAAVPRIPVTAEMFDKARTADVESETDRRHDLEAAWDQLPVPDSCPAIEQILWDGGEHLWVRRWEWDLAEPTATPTYDVVTREGRWLGTVEVPSALGEVQTVTADHVLTVWKNDMDVQFVHVYRILRPAAD